MFQAHQYYRDDFFLHNQPDTPIIQIFILS